MERAIEMFLNVYGEDFDKISKIKEDDRYLEAVNENNAAIAKTTKVLEQVIGQNEAEEVVEELTNSFYVIMRLREHHSFKQGFMLGTNVGIDIQKHRPDYPLMND